MKKRISALLLALCLLAVPVQAADSMDHFVRARAYDGQFSDLTGDSVFYGNVAALYEYGLSNGKTDGTFGLTDSLTVGQAVIFAGRIRSLYQTGDPETGASAFLAEGLPVYLPYLLYLQSEGLLGPELDEPCAQGAVATRAQMAHVLANILPAEALPPIHDELVTQAYASRRFITDVTEYTPYYHDILTLYRCGVSQGSDETGSFLPDAQITRGAAAAMLTRLVDPSLRTSPSWKLEESTSAAGTTLSDLVDPGAYLPAPQTAEEIDQSIRYMLASGSNVLPLQYSGISLMQARKIMEQSLATVKQYCEQSYNSVSCTYAESGTMTLTFSAAGAGDDLEAYRTETMEAAIAVHDQLWESGQLATGMTETEKALAYYTWICENTTYDHGAADDSLSHIPYGLFHTGTAVCDGYTGAYNLFLKLEGIRCTALSNTGHIWTVAELDGTEVHIDTTWGDSGSQTDYAYFAMTPEESYREHPW